MDTIKLAECVEKGANLLDRKRPGWYNGIDTGKLDQASTNQCVLGQTFGSYYDGCVALGANTDEDTREFGYYCPDLRDYPSATLMWANEVDRRRLRDARAERTVEPVFGNQITVTKAQIEQAKEHINSVYTHADSFIEELTPAGCLAHILMSLDIKVKVED